MPDDTPWLRTSPRFIAQAFVSSLRENGLPILIGLIALTVTRGGFQIVSIIYLAVYVLLQVGGNLLQWRRLCYRLTDEALEVRSGMLTVRTTALAWADVGAVTIARTPLQRAFDIATLEADARNSTVASLKLPGLRLADAEAMRKLVLAHAAHARPGNAAPGRSVEAVEGDSAKASTAAGDWTIEFRQPLYQMGGADYFIGGLLLGRFFALVPLLAVIYWQVVEALNITVTLNDIGRWVAGFAAVTLALAALGILAASLLFGWVTSWLRYRKFTVWLSDDALWFSGGLSLNQQRRLRFDQVDAVCIEQNLWMRLSRRAQLRVVATTKDDSYFADILIPVGRLAAVEEVAALLLERAGVPAPEPSPATVRAASISSLLIGLGLLVALPLATMPFVVEANSVFFALLLLGAMVIGYWTLNLAVDGLRLPTGAGQPMQFDEGWIGRRRLWTVFPGTAHHVGVSQGPWLRLFGRFDVRVSLRSGSVVRLNCPYVPAPLTDRFLALAGAPDLERVIR